MLSQQVRTVRGFEADGDERWNMSVCTLHARLVRQPPRALSDSTDAELTATPGPQPQLGPTPNNAPRWRFQPGTSDCSINARNSASPQLERPDNLRVLVSIERGLVGIRERHTAAGPLLWQHQVHCTLTLHITLCSLLTFVYTSSRVR